MQLTGVGIRIAVAADGARSSLSVLGEHVLREDDMKLMEGGGGG